MMKHILIVGGTGMLKGTATHFIEKGYIVSILARNRDRLDGLRREYPQWKGRILPIAQDYRNSEQALKKVKEAAEMYAYIDTAVLWIHDTGRQFSEEVKKFIFSHHPDAKVYQLLGHALVNPVQMSQSTWQEQYPNRYREIFLGYQRKGSSSRWLTNREISEGTIQAVEEDRPEFTVGITEPWEARP